ncbi:MAG TPA: sodium:proton antiporter [Phycisphaerales bacterium]|nr:sodium:proton antiporter [Phycisphaerales bacterium]HMP38690.1 sodium:proton antiporter [Phycisphaerales bacterium]
MRSAVPSAGDGERLDDEDADHDQGGGGRAGLRFAGSTDSGFAHSGADDAVLRGTRSALACVALGVLLLTLLVVGLLGGHGSHADSVDAVHSAALGAERGDAAHAAHAPPGWPLGVVPFVVLLAAIAFLPLVPALARWWHSNLSRLLVSLGLAAATCAYLIAVEGVAAAGTAVEHAVLAEYVPFIVLLFSLYVVTGGIAIHGKLPATPAMNTTIIALGTLLASAMGTTGASMLFIRPLLQTNRNRRHRAHTVIFFIILVSNVGGLLLPVGDPPLFLGYLRGVPFLWTLGLWPEGLFAAGILLAVYFAWDTALYRREATADLQRDLARIVPERVEGGINFLFLLGVLLSVALVSDTKPLPGTEWTPPWLAREALMLGFAGLSIAFTPRAARLRNEFDYHAILEVAAIFIGIFITMQVPLMVLRVHGAELGIREPWQFFWATGVLSSFLDNAPTYQVFFETALTMQTPPESGLALHGGAVIDARLLAAISVAAVFMGAMTYIGNGPNFMVKSIADRSGVRMPTFFGYMVYSSVVLLPVLLATTLIFFR